MKIVRAWPDYAANGIVAVAEDGEVFLLPILDKGRLVGTEWLPFAPAIGVKRKSSSSRPHIDSVHAAFEHWYARNPKKPDIIFASPADMDRWHDEIVVNGAEFIGPTTRSQLMGIELVPDRRVSDGTLLLCDSDLKWIGTVRFE
jgi:hypothetical protein